MEYSVIHGEFLITQKDLHRFTIELKHAMKKYRQAANIPLQKRKREGMLENIDHAEKGIIEACKSIGVNFGVQWGEEIDLSGE